GIDAFFAHFFNMFQNAGVVAIFNGGYQFVFEQIRLHLQGKFCMRRDSTAPKQYQKNIFAERFFHLESPYFLATSAGNICAAALSAACRSEAPQRDSLPGPRESPAQLNPAQ